MTGQTSQAKGIPGGFSLVELLVMIGVIGIMVTIAVTAIGKISDRADETAAKNNAQQMGSVSASLSGLGVAHVIPESLGGTEATCRLLRRGIEIPDGPMQGSHFSVPGVSDDDISSVAVYLDISYADLYVLRMIYNANAVPKR